MFNGATNRHYDFFTAPGFGHIAVNMPHVDGVNQCIDIGISGQQDSNSMWVHLVGFLKQLDTGHLRHSLITDNNCKFPFLEQFDGRDSAVCRVNIVVSSKSPF